jgi:malonyl-CoA decarboxylase
MSQSVMTREIPASEQPRRRSALERLRGSRLGKLFSRIGIGEAQSSGDGLLELADALLSSRGKASGPALASAFFDLYEESDLGARRAFLSQVYDRHPHNADAIDQAIARWNEVRDDAAASRLNGATEPPCHKLIRRLNLAPDGTGRLIAMREDLLGIRERTDGVRALDREFEKAFTAWFNAGFLELRRIGWDSPAALLERIIRYEAVHEIEGWEDLRRRVQPVDRRCYGFFHPQMADDPLIFVEVALTRELPGGIRQIIAEERKPIAPKDARFAIFYSISNCQNGLRGIPFGNYLIKRVVGQLQAELGNLDGFATLSPVPGFAKWLATEPGMGEAVPPASELRKLAARYLTTARSHRGQVLDSVARFHLGNGARLEAIHAGADMSENGLRQSHGIMVNYVYDLAELEANYFALSEMGTVAASPDIHALLDNGESGGKGSRKDKRAA